MAATSKQLNAKNVRAMMGRLETAAGRIEREFERQLKALDRAREAMAKEAKRQLDSIRREQRGFLTRVRQAAKTSTPSRPRTTKRSTAARRTTTTGRRTTARSRAA